MKLKEYLTERLHPNDVISVKLSEEEILVCDNKTVRDALAGTGIDKCYLEYDFINLRIVEHDNIHDVINKRPNYVIGIELE